MKKTILVIDDNPSINDALSLILESEDYHVITLTDGGQASNVVGETHPDLIIIDYLLSGKNGKEITREMKSHTATKHTPIIMMSAHPQAREESKKAGANDFLEKPFDAETLLLSVKKYL